MTKATFKKLVYMSNVLQVLQVFTKEYLCLDSIFKQTSYNYCIPFLWNQFYSPKPWESILVF